MEHLNWSSRPDLRKPALICAFRGWNDAAESASLALSFLAGRWEAKPFASFDPDELFDFQETRPIVRLAEGRAREIEWPDLAFSMATPPGHDRDVVLFGGPEPQLRWRSVCDTIVATAGELGVDTVITFGALLADVPHTRPVALTGIASDPELVEVLGFSNTRYEGPTGITGVLHDSCARAGVRSASLWAPVPHYVAAVASPKASLALVNQAQELLGVELDTTELEQATADYERRLDEAVEREPEVRQLVERLEQQLDDREVSFGDLPSGDSIAQEFQRFLRDQGDEK